MNYKPYSHLLLEERHFIQLALETWKWKVTKIASTLERSRATIYRELKRNNKQKQYYYQKAHQLAKQRTHAQVKFILKAYPKFSKLFKLYFNKKVSGVKATYFRILKEDPKIKCPSWRQVYNWINSNYWVISKKDCLRKAYRKGKRRHIGIFIKVQRKHIKPYWARPNCIKNRERLGDWEADLVIGKKKSGANHLLTLTDRKTRFTIITKVKSKNSYYILGVMNNIIKQYQKLGLPFHSITIDNGFEFLALGLLSYYQKIDIYRCEPFASYQRGSNEHVNGIIRRFYKKGTDFTFISHAKIETMAVEINNMSRELFRWNSAFKMLAQELNS